LQGAAAGVTSFLVVAPWRPGSAASYGTPARGAMAPRWMWSLHSCRSPFYGSQAWIASQLDLHKNRPGRLVCTPFVHCLDFIRLSAMRTYGLPTRPCAFYLAHVCCKVVLEEYIVRRACRLFSCCILIASCFRVQPPAGLKPGTSLMC